MKFSWKIFIYTYIIMVVSFGISGFLIIETSFENNLNSRQDGLVESNQYLAESYAAIRNVDERLSTSLTEVYCSNVSREEENSRVFIGTYPQITNYEKKLFDEYLTEGKRLMRVIQKNGKPFLQVISVPYYSDKQSAELVCIENLENISDIFKNRDDNYQQFQIILLLVSGVSGLMLLLAAKHLTDPLKKLSQAAREIGNGCFDKRVNQGKTNVSAEIRSLTEDFNRMAGYVETYIYELKEENRRREEFVNNFTHELKTPLTSVIGYADLLRSYDVEFEKRRQFAEYIFHEGTRMEALALNLLDLIVLRKQEFDLKLVNIEHFLYEAEKSLIFVMEKYHAALHIECEPCMVWIEPDLLKTFIYNLVDNGCKAMADNEQQGKTADIYIRGYMRQERYQIEVRDTGIGIEEEEISKITEEFYMVDKSRARTMGGAGLGLSLCREIAKIHGSILEINSEVGKGTCVSLSLAVKKIDREEMKPDKTG